MGTGGFWQKVPTADADEVKRLVDEAGAGDTVLLDVREPEEYDQGHLPGARLIPLSQLADRIDELDRSKPIVTY